MRSVDTNVALRLIFRDDERQAQIVESLLGDGFMLGHTVLLETIWVLNTLSGWNRHRIADAMHDLISLPTVQVNCADQISWALQKYMSGADFADMLHLALSGGADAFSTFDRKIVRYANDSIIPVETLG
jgi:predicted nucleic-acid-binding protein